MSIVYNNQTNSTENNTLPDVQTSDNQLPTRVVLFFSIVTMIAAILINCLTLVAFIKERSLRNSFSYYLISLTIADLGCGCSIAFFVADYYYERSLLSYDGCAFYILFQWTFMSAEAHLVMLIGFDRMWAVLWPLHYRQYKTKTVATGLIATVWVWILCCMLPGVIVERMAPSGDHCEIHTDTAFKQIWFEIINYVCYILPTVLMMLANVFIVHKVNLRARKVALARLVQSASGLGPRVSTEGPPVTCITTAATGMASPNVNPARLISENAARAKKDREILHLYGWLTLSVTVLWLPSAVYWTLIPYFPELYNDWVKVVFQIWHYSTFAVNPLIYQANSKEMRQTISTMFYGIRKC